MVFVRRNEVILSDNRPLFSGFKLFGSRWQAFCAYFYAQKLSLSFLGRRQLDEQGTDVYCLVVIAVMSKVMICIACLLLLL